MRKPIIAGNWKMTMSIAEAKNLVTAIKDKINRSDVVKIQVEKGLTGVDKAALADVVIAYEPIWAIGTGKTATSGQANEVITYIRQVVTDMFDGEAAAKVRIQYGGSVKPANISEIMNESDIDGALVGGASLQLDSYLGLVNF